MSEWKKTLCNLCAVTCGLEMEVEDNRIVSVRPDPDSPNSECYCCRKGRTAKYFVENSERILYPKKRVGDHYERISWEQAYAEIAEKANAILKAHGPRSAAIIGAGGGPTGAASEETGSPEAISRSSRSCRAFRSPSVSRAFRSAEDSFLRE